ncbi:MAG: CPBP family intramembrane glutamic endopeptidase [Myxococcota bacterium]
MPFIRRLWSKAFGELPENWNSDDPTQKLGAAELWLLSLICMYGIFIGEFYSITGHPLIVASYRFIQHGCIPLCALGVVLAKQQRKVPILPLLGLLVATVPFILRMGFVGKLSRRLSGEYFEANSKYIAVSLLLSLTFALWSLWKDGLKLHRWGMGSGDWRWWLPRTGIALGILIPTLAVVLNFDSNLAGYYPIWKAARQNIGNLMLSNGSYGIDMLAWECLFRGILLFGYARRGDPHTAIWAQTVPFFFLHASKPDSELIGSLFGGLVCGWFCLRARSFWPLFILHWAQLMTVNSVSYALRVM